MTKLKDKIKEDNESNNSFEDNLKALEMVVTELESGNLALNECIKKFETGVSLYKNCKNELSKAEKKIAILSEDLKEDEFCE